MNITFMIGNGFDLNQGLRTRYEDFYPYFLSKASKDNMIHQWLKNDDTLWSDLEMNLGKSLVNVQVDQREQFYEDKAELDTLLLDYLEEEKQRFICDGNEDMVAEEMHRSLTSFYSGLPEAERNSIDATLKQYGNEEFRYCFICFNYTDILDQIVDVTKKKRNPVATHVSNGNRKNNTVSQVLHIHGTLQGEAILGVNDTEQINNNFLRSDEEFLDTFIKERINNNIAQRKTEHARDMINKSHLICIFGMSLGMTDKMWWQELVKWLALSESNKLVVFYKGYEDELRRMIPGKTIRLKNQLKNQLLQIAENSIEDEKKADVMSRMFVAFNSDIFNFGQATSSKQLRNYIV